MGQYVTVECPNPDCGRSKRVWIDGRETRAGSTCGGCGTAWEYELADFR
jgi:hypothetical protein